MKLKKILLFTFAILIIPQILFSQVKKPIKKIVSKENNFKKPPSQINEKAMNPFPEYTILKSCSYSAKPQGFLLRVYNLKGGDGVSDKWVITVDRENPCVYSKKKNIPLHAGDSEYYLGDQTTNQGVTNFGWARDESGVLIQGPVYRYCGEKFGQGSVFTGDPITGGRVLKEGIGRLELNCSVSNLNLILHLYLPDLPIISGSSIAYNDGSAVQTSGGSDGVNHNDWVGDMYSAVYNMNGQPGWKYTTVDYNTYLEKNGLSQYHLTTPKEYFELRNQIRRIKQSQYLAWRKDNTFKFVQLKNDVSTLQLMEIEDVELETIGNTMSLEEVDALVPMGFGMPDYPAPRTPEGTYNTKKLYPSYLFDKPMTQSWYLGNSMGNSGAGVTLYKHAPLPTYCNPNNEDYIPAAYLNPLVLEELRNDWAFLTLKNVEELKAKGYDEFYEELFWKFYKQCSSNGQMDCFQQIMTENPNLVRKTYLDPNGTMPVINNNVNAQNTIQKSKTDDELNTLPRPKKLIKTEDYYSNLINNKLIIMNPVWLENKRLKKCFPKYKAIHNSKIVKKVKKKILKKTKKL